MGASVGAAGARSAGPDVRVFARAGPTPGGAAGVSNFRVFELVNCRGTLGAGVVLALVVVRAGFGSAFGAIFVRPVRLDIAIHRI